MFARIATTLGAGVAGYAMEQIYKNRKERTEGLNTETKDKVDRGFETGDEKLKRVADDIRPKQTSGAADYAKDYLQQRKETLEHAASVTGSVLSCDVSIDNLKDAYKKGKEDVALGVDLGKVGIKVAKDGVDPSEATKDARRVVMAGANQKKDEIVKAVQEKPLEAVKVVAEGAKKAAHGTYAAGTITDKGIKEVGDAAFERVKDDSKRIGTGIGITVATSTVLRAIPHPAAQVLATGVQIIGAATAGKQVADALHKVNNSHSDNPTTRVMRDEARQILREKAESVPLPKVNKEEL